MTTFQMECFLESAKELNFSKAAANLFISQPALSRHIANMEKELNVRLFERTANKRIKLTNAGEAYFNLYYNFMQEAEVLRDKYDKDKLDPFGTFSFGYLRGWDISFFLPEILDTFEKGHAGVNVKFEGLPQSEILSRIEAGNLDVALIPWEYLPKSNKIRWEDVVEINNLILFSDRFIQNNPEAVRVSDLKNASFFFTPESISVQRKGLMQFLNNETGFTPKVSTLPNDDTVMSYVNAGLGVLLTDSWGRNSHTKGYQIFKLNAPRRIVLIWPANIKHNLPNKIVRELRSVLTSMQDDDRCFTILDEHK